MLRDILRDEIEKAVKKLFSTKVEFVVNQGGIHADYSTNAVLRKVERLARAFSVPFGDVIQMGKGSPIETPRENAEFLKNELLKSNEFNKYFSKIEIANGFLNFWLSEEGLKEGLENLNKKFPKQKEKISLDYLDANPTGPVHLGHARSGFYGDVLANILEFYGHKVSREFYVNNAKSSGQIKSLGKTALGEGEEYKHEQLNAILKKPEAREKLRKISAKGGSASGGKDESEAGFYIADLVQKENEIFLKNIAKIKFDVFFEEERVYSSGLIKEILGKLEKAGATYKKDGAIWLKSSELGDTEDRVLVRSTGEPTYILPDVGYHLDRLVERKYDKAINIFGADHYGYGPRLKAALKVLGVLPEKIEIIIYQMVRLVKDGKEVKMSKREGIFVTLEELIKEVGLDAARFFFLLHSIGSHMDFDLDLAKERSKKNPVYYVQYSHARACSIIRKSGFIFKIFKPQTEVKNPNKFERNLILKLIQFPEIIEDIVKDYQVHRLTTYVYELAKVFTDFYENVRVLNAENKQLKKSRLALVSTAKNILEKSLSLMGISAPERM